jgi:hypothetical protein
MRSLRTAVFISCFLAVPAIFAQVSGSQVPASDWRFAHPGATLVGGFRVKAMLDSPLVSNLIALGTADDPSKAAMVGMARTALAGVYEVRFSVRDMGKGKNPDVLALVKGTLDDTAAAALAQGKTGIRRLDANSFLVGEGPSLDEAVTRMNKPATGLQARALDRSKALANNDLWIAGTLPALPMTIPVLDSLRSLAVGISAQSDLRVEIGLEMANAKMAEDLVSSARRSQTTQPALGAALQTEVDGTTARFRFVMEGTQVVQAVQQAMASKGAQSPFSGLLGQSSVVFEPATPAKPKRDTIIIYGMEGGPREIKTTDKP